MAPFSIPAPFITPLRLPIFGGSKSIDTNTKIQLLCETYLDHEIFYTLDGTKPQPYAGIVQGSKTIKYSAPFYLPAGKVTIKAMAINSVVHTMCSSVVTKCFDVLKVESDKEKQNQQQKNAKTKKKVKPVNNENGKCIFPQEVPTIKVTELGSDVKSEAPFNCFEEAFIGGSDFELDNSGHDDSVEDEKGSSIDEDLLDAGNLEEPEETLLSHMEGESYDQISFEAVEKLIVEDEKLMNKANVTLTDSGTSLDTHFCCMKCDLTLQQCDCCNKMNAISSKFCIGCGKQLLQICISCRQSNPGIAAFCQYCGKKMGTRMEPFTSYSEMRVDHAVMAKPKLKNVCVQKLPSTIDKYTQTVWDKSPQKKCSPIKKRIPRHSPGRGYWHQQLDYICNHLKSYTYNNPEFRKEISEPTLCDFKSAQITKDDENIVVTVIFSPFVTDKSVLDNNAHASEDGKHKDQDST